MYSGVPPGDLGRWYEEGQVLAPVSFSTRSDANPATPGTPVLSSSGPTVSSVSPVSLSSHCTGSSPQDSTCTGGQGDRVTFLPSGVPRSPVGAGEERRGRVPPVTQSGYRAGSDADATTKVRVSLPCRQIKRTSSPPRPRPRPGLLDWDDQECEPGPRDPRGLPFPPRSPD